MYLKKKKFSSLRRDNDYMWGIKFWKGFENPRPVYREQFSKILNGFLHFLLFMNEYRRIGPRMICMASLFFIFQQMILLIIFYSE